MRTLTAQPPFAGSQAPRPGEGLEIHRLTPDRTADFLRFFDNEAFRDHPEWGFCYCQCFLEDHAKINWPERTGAENRALACRRIETGTMRGFLAYSGGDVVGWFNAAPRRLFHALDDEPSPSDEATGTILCFLVVPAQRGAGIARALLGAACDGLRADGLTLVEANPRPEAKGDAANHFGPMSLYTGAGFTVRRKDSDGSVWVDKRL